MVSVYFMNSLHKNSCGFFCFCYKTGTMTLIYTHISAGTQHLILVLNTELGKEDISSTNSFFSKTAFICFCKWTLQLSSKFQQIIEANMFFILMQYDIWRVHLQKQIKAILEKNELMLEMSSLHSSVLRTKIKCCVPADISV